MKYIFKTKKILFYFSILITIFIFLDQIRSTLKQLLPSKIQVTIKQIIFGKEKINEINHLYRINYNTLRIPKTQFINIEFNTVKINEISIAEKNHYEILNQQQVVRGKKKFFIRNYEDGLLLIDSKNNLFKLILNNNETNISYSIKKISNNLENLRNFNVKDFLIINNKIFASFSVYDEKNRCSKFIIFASESIKNVNFKEVLSSKECIQNVVGGKMIYINFNEYNGILFSTGDDDYEGKLLAQNQNSIFGKLIFFDLKTNNHRIFSSGHRNPQGLLITKDNRIISTEHGPYGGDEINIISEGKNYGWPFSSYGEPYGYNFNKDYKYKKSHEFYGFEEPIYSFVPSIGISQIIEVPENFNSKWKNNYIVSSLNSNSLYRIKFDEKLTKVIYVEKIFIGERIRDIIYNHHQNVFYLALEETGSIGLLKYKK